MVVIHERQTWASLFQQICKTQDTHVPMHAISPTRATTIEPLSQNFGVGCMNPLNATNCVN